MCGIAGFIGWSNHKELAINAGKLQKHRGPDNQSVWSDEYISLAHQRLSIIDLSENANQPFCKYDLVIIFNGEIYNYKEIKQMLIKKYSINFSTNSDTEVLLEAYKNEGEKCLEYFIGMFAFVIYNKTSKELFGARDHTGIKPFYYYSENRNFAFASELKSILQIPQLDKKINTYSLVGAKNLLWVPGNESIFQSINKLKPGCYFKYTPNKELNIQQYWKLKPNIQFNNENDYIEYLDIELNKSIERHLIADVNVSSFLSGGLDSSLISVLAQQKMGKQLTTYTIKLNEKDKKIEQATDDAYYANILAKKFGFNHNEINISADIIQNLHKIIYHLEEPIGDPAAINTLLICNELQKNNDRVILSGMGADELFFGYRRQQATLLAEKYNYTPSFIRKGIKNIVTALPVKIGNKGIVPIRWAKRFLDLSEGNLSDIYLRSYSYYNRNTINNLFNEDIQVEIDQLYQKHENIFFEFKQDSLNKMCYTDVFMFMNGLNLFYTDKSSMAASIEVRVPFIDKEIIEAAFKINGNLKYRKGISKYLLKKVAEKYLPKEIIYRKKASFSAPLRSWISDDLKEVVDEYLSESTIKKRGIFNYPIIKKMIDDDRNGKSDYAYQIYQLLTTEIFFQTFIDKSIT